jgi:hypothetical protein
VPPAKANDGATDARKRRLLNSVAGLMLQWTAAGSGPRFGLLVHHTDAEREWAYDRNSPVGRLDKALDEAQAKGSTVVDMKRDWKMIYQAVVSLQEEPGRR